MLNRAQLRLGTYEHQRLGDAGQAAAVCHDLYATLAECMGSDGPMLSFAAAFPAHAFVDEAGFESALWAQLQAMHDIDRQHFAWDEGVSADPESAAFSMSLGGVAWYVVGLHPAASRMARRFDAPLVVFNRHAQFEDLRSEGRYQPLRARIRQRDQALQGNVNPMLKDHGSESEARQYAGREVGAAWRCPLQRGQAVG